MVFPTRVHAVAVYNGVELTPSGMYRWLAISEKNEQLGFISGL